MKFLFLLLFYSLSSLSVTSQQCHEIFRTRDKDIGWETYYGSVQSGPWYVSVAKQFYHKDSIPPNYYILLYSKLMKKVDAVTRSTFGTIRLQFDDISYLILDSVKFSNFPPVLEGVSVKVYLTEEEMLGLNSKPLVQIFFNEEEIFLNRTKRAKFSRIVACLVKQ